VPAAFYPQEDSWYSFLLEAESTPRAIVRLEGLSQLKNLMTSSGIEPATFRLVATPCPVGVVTKCSRCTAIIQDIIQRENNTSENRRHLIADFQSLHLVWRAEDRTRAPINQILPSIYLESISRRSGRKGKYLPRPTDLECFIRQRLVYICTTEPAVVLRSTHYSFINVNWRVTTVC
jgi:hypothetical protein